MLPDENFPKRKYQEHLFSTRFEPKDAATTKVGPLVPGWTLWQLADSALPTGGFMHSSGLEAAFQHGEVRNRSELLSFLETSLHQIGGTLIPLLVAAHKCPEELPKWDSWMNATLPNHVTNRASYLQGRALLNSMAAIFRHPQFTCWKSSKSDKLPHNHLAPVFGACYSILEIDLDTCGSLFLFQQLRGLLNSAVRLGVCGPMELQQLLHVLEPATASVWANCRHLSPAEAVNTSPLLDLWQSNQDRLYSRLFQS